MAEDAGSIYSEIRIKLDKLGTDIAAAEAQIKKMGTALDAQTSKDSASVAKNYTDAFGKINIGAAAIATGATVAFRSLVSTFAATEQSLANVRSVTNASASEFDKLKKAAVDAGDRTRFSASQAADALYALASGGLDATQSAEALNGVLLLAGATQSDLAFTSETLTATLSQYSMEASQAEEVSNLFAAAIGNSQATIEKLAVSLRTVGPVAGTLGISLSETTASLEALYNAGFTGETAGTALRDILMDLSNATGPAMEKLNALGITFDSVNPATVGLTGAIAALGASGASTTDLMAALGKTSGAQLAVLLKTGEDGLKSLEKGIIGTDAAARQYAIQNDTLAGSLDELSSKAETAGNSLVEQLTPSMRGLSGVAGAILGFFSGLPDILQGVITGFITLGGGVLVANTALTTFGITMGALLGPIALIAAGIGAVVVGTTSMISEMNKAAELRLSDQFESVSNESNLAGKSMEDFAGILSKLELAFIKMEGSFTNEKMIATVKDLSNQYGIAEKTVAKLVITSGNILPQMAKQLDLQYGVTAEAFRQSEINTRNETQQKRIAGMTDEQLAAEKKKNDQLKATELLQNSIVGVDKLLAKGILDETEALKQKISIRQKVVESIQDEVLKTGTLTAAQTAQLAAQNASIDGYEARLGELEQVKAAADMTDLERRKATLELIKDEDARAYEEFLIRLEEKRLALETAGVSEAEIAAYTDSQIVQYKVDSAVKINEIEAKAKADADALRKADLKKEEEANKYKTDLALQFASAAVALFDQVTKNEISSIEARTTKKKSALDTELAAEKAALDLDYKNRLAAGEDKDALDKEFAKKNETLEQTYADKKTDIEEKARREIADLQYRSAVADWWLKQAQFASSIPAVYTTAAIQLGPVAGPIAASALVGLQEAAMIAAFPKPAKFETGGIVVGGSSGAMIQVAENGTTEAMFNSGASGRPFLEAFADLVAERAGGGTQQIVVELDSMVLATATVERINNGNVRLTVK